MPDNKSELENLWNFLSQVDPPPKKENVIISISDNWYDNLGKEKKVKELYKKFIPKKILLGGGMGRFSTEKAISLGGEAYEMKEILVKLGLPKEKILTFVNGKFTTDNINAILHYAKENNYSNLIVPEESYLVQRVRATFHSRKKLIFPSATISIIPIHTFSEFLELHNHDVALFLINGEIKRLLDYSNKNSGSPKIFSKEEAFKGAEKFEGIDKVLKDSQEIKKYYDEAKLKKILNSENALNYFTPRQPITTS